MSKEATLKIARAIEKTRPSTSMRRVAYQEAIHSANRKGEITNNEGTTLLWLLDNVQSFHSRRGSKRRVVKKRRRVVKKRRKSAYKRSR